jgi:hypothetical protein
MQQEATSIEQHAMTNAQDQNKNQKYKRKTQCQ